MPKLESEVIKDVRNTLSFLEVAGDVLWYSRLNSGMVRDQYGAYIHLCKKGTFDYICIFKNKKGTLTALFIECKREGVKVLRDSQKEFLEQYDGCHPDIIFLLADSDQIVKDKIKEMCFDRLASINLC